MSRSIKKIFAILLCISICGITNAFAESISPAYTFTRTDSGKLFYDIAVGTTTSVAVGKNGRIYYDDAGNWKAADCGSFDDFHYIFFTGNKFVAIGRKTVISSLDGRSWQCISENNGILPDGVIIDSNGMFVVEKSDGIYTTNDFLTYNKISSAGSKLNIFRTSIQMPKLMLEAENTDNACSNLKYYYDMIFENNEMNTAEFDKKLALLINLSGINVDLLPTKPENIEYIEVTGSETAVYYVKEFSLVKTVTSDFEVWNETVIDLPEQNAHLTGVAIGKISNEYILAYDTNESSQTNKIYKRKKYVTSADLSVFDDFAMSDVRGDSCVKDGRVYILTATGVYRVENGDVLEVISDEITLADKVAVINTDRYNFMWKRGNDGTELYWNNTGEWAEIADADSFIKSHYIGGNANYQILWTGDTYVIRPTDYDNGYNPTGAKGEIHIYDENFNPVKSVNLDNYILQMSFVNGKCYVLTDKNTVMYSGDFDNWITDEDDELPMTNGNTNIYKILTKADNKYNYLHKIKSIINQNIKKELLYENWKGNKVVIAAGKYLRYDDSTVSLSDDGVYWKDISLPIGIDGIEQVRVDNSNIVIITPNINLTYSINGITENTTQPYVEINDYILGFDTPPVIESDRTLVPLRFIFEVMGADVDWESETMTAVVSNKQTTIRFTIDNPNANVNNTIKTMDVPARLINDKTLIPLRFLSEELGYKVDWNEDAKTVTISD